MPRTPGTPTIYEMLPVMLREWNRADPSGCWDWPYARRTGYGVVSVRGVSVYAHRATYEMLVGPIPEGLQIDHLCRNKACVNPGHMEPVTARTNTLRSDNRAAINARKFVCKRGHALSGSNVVIYTGRSRVCRTCERERGRRAIGYKGNLPGNQRTHCRHGHPLSGENLRLNPRPTYMERVCRTCENKHQQAYLARKRQKRSA